MRIQVFSVNLTGANPPTFNAYHPFLEFEIPYGGGSGYYQIPVYPDWGSVEVEPRRLRNTNMLASNTLDPTNPDGWGDRNTKLQIYAEFSHVSQTAWDTLQRYLYWQDRGYMLNLHTSLNDVPWCLTGHLTLSKMHKSSSPWLSSHGFAFFFEEA